MTNEHKEHMAEIKKLQSRIDDLRDAVKKLHYTAEYIHEDMKRARCLLEDMKKRWEAMDDDKA